MADLGETCDASETQHLLARRDRVTPLEISGIKAGESWRGSMNGKCGATSVHRAEGAISGLVCVVQLTQAARAVVGTDVEPSLERGYPDAVVQCERRVLCSMLDGRYPGLRTRVRQGVH